ncbi:hypothetical protein ACFV6F_17455 [Kitasatospora phosalacinea]|uniref:hypothetical protein n=1 Tax=Kitasatospora phosalacinea TaxID=2065 RepID=UPI00364AE143
MSDQLTFLPLSYAARPPRLVVVAPQNEGWVRWSAAALARLSRVWGCSGSVVLPAGTVEHPALQRGLARLQPDHVVPYVPSVGAADEIIPGLIDRFLARQGIDDAAVLEQIEPSLRKQPCKLAFVEEAEAAAGALRSRLVANQREDYLHVHHLFDDVDSHFLTALESVATAPLLGVPKPLVTTTASLAYAMHVGVQERPSQTSVEARHWLQAAAQGSESPLLKELHPDAAADALAMMSHSAGLCIPVRRGFRRGATTVVLGEGPEDFALAQVLRQLHDTVVWLPGEELSLASMRLFHLGRRSDQMTVTSASLDQAEVQRKIDELWDKRGFRMIDPAEEEKPSYTVVDPRDLDFHGRSMVVLQTAWDQPESLPAAVMPDGSLETALALAVTVPPGLDPVKHRWQVTLTCADHPLPPLAPLTGAALITSDQSLWQTFVRAADGGITYWSHRFDFVASGASLAGTLAAPKLRWPSIGNILERATAATETRLRPSAAGKRAAITERLLGSRKALEALAASPGWPLLRRFLPDEARKDLPQGSWWKLKSAVVLSWEAVVAQEHAEWDAPARRAQIDEWTRQGVLRRGLVLGCGHCPIFEFYPLAEISQDYRCRRCGGANSLVQERWKPFGEPSWFFDLHPAVLELVANDGDVPLLATQYLRTQPWARPALVGEEFELLREGNPFVEIDFALATNDELWLGEAKKGNKFDGNRKEQQREIYKLFEGCSAVGATGLVLATAQPAWSAELIGIIQDELRGRRKVQKDAPEVRLLAGLREGPRLTSLSPDGAG